MIIKNYDLTFCEDKAKVTISKGAQILSIGVRKDFRLGRFYEVPFMMVKEEEGTEKEEICVRRILAVAPVEVKEWQEYLGTFALDNGTSTYMLITAE